MYKKSFLILIFALFVNSACQRTVGEEPLNTLSTIVPEILELNEQKPQVLMLGSFHFKDAGLDQYKPKYSVDIQSELRQKELEQILVALEKFNPTKIIVERRPGYQNKLDSLYSEYKNGNFDSSNEIVQIGFNLAKRLGHNRVIAGDSRAKGMPWNPGDREKFDSLRKNIIDSEKIESVIESKYDDLMTKLYSHEDSLKSQVPLKEYFLYLNSKERLDAYFGSYLTGDIAVNDGNQYPHVDNLTAWWINRNYRIFSNMRKEIESKNERILVIFGAAHVGVLRPLVEASPEMQMIEVKDIL